MNDFVKGSCLECGSNSNMKYIHYPHSLKISEENADYSEIDRRRENEDSESAI